ncbi:MAG: geranylgeranyl reductase family protein [Phycisphaerae bacterium]
MLYDVLVVGAGPAGAAAAKFLADSGATVALVDGARFPRAKSCAGWLNAHAVRDCPFLDAARRKVRAAPFRRLLFHSPDLQATARYSSRSHLGYIISRKQFDAALVRLAADAGAETFLGRKVVAVQAAERNVTLTLTSGRRLVGRLLVGADGAAGIVARSLGLRDRWENHQVVACLAKDVPLTRKQSADGFQGAIHVAPGFGGASGYAWAFPGAGAVNIGIGIRATEAGRLQSLYDAWADGLRRKAMLPKRANLARPSGAVIPAGAAIEFDNHVGKRTILVGDAGGFAAAATGEGIYPGIWSASIAARSILEALAADRGEKKGTTCQDALLAFRSEWRREMASYLQMPNVNLVFLLPLIFTNQEIADRFARAFLFGENL